MIVNVNGAYSWIIVQVYVHKNRFSNWFRTTNATPKALSEVEIRFINLCQYTKASWIADYMNGI